MTHVACESKLRSLVRSFIHPWPRNWVTIGRAVVYYARAGIKCHHSQTVHPRNKIHAFTYTQITNKKILLHYQPRNEKVAFRGESMTL